MSAAVAYDQFIAAKSQRNTGLGFEPVYLPDFLFDFQAFVAAWTIETGRAAIFGDCGTGKTPMELVWAENIRRYTRGNVLIGAPLAVAQQIVRESEKFGIEVRLSRDGTVCPGITVTNYEKLHLFSPLDFAAFVGDESSILKSFDGARRNAITRFMRQMQCRLLGSASPAPNDYTEFGTTSEALGYLGHVDMLNRFFVNDANNSAQGRTRGEAAQWRFKGHAERAFWRFLCSFARAFRKPSDLGFADGAFVLPPLIEREHVLESLLTPEDSLFALPAVRLHEERQEARRTIGVRCEYVASLVNAHTEPAIAWCQLNDESAALAKRIPDSVEICGGESDDAKEAKLLEFATGNARVLVTKPSIGGWGLNFQHCAHQTFFPSHSFEQYYQAVRRSYRFGQKREVKIDMVTSTGGAKALASIQRKAELCDRLFSNLVAEMNDALGVARANPFTRPEAIPAWLS